MLVAPGPMEVVQAIMRRRREAFAKAMAACAMACSLWARKVGSVVANAVQRLAHARDVAVAEDGPDAAEQRHDMAVDLGLLRGHRLDERLRHGEADRACHRHLLRTVFVAFRRICA